MRGTRTITVGIALGWAGSILVRVTETINELNKIEWTFRLDGVELKVHRQERLRRPSKRHRKWLATETWPTNRAAQPVPPDDVAEAALTTVRNAISIKGRP